MAGIMIVMFMACAGHSNQNGDGFLTESRKGSLGCPHPLSNRNLNENHVTDVVVIPVIRTCWQPL